MGNPLYSDSELNAVMNGEQNKNAAGYVHPDFEDPKQLDQVVQGTYQSPSKYKNPWTAPFELIRDSYELGDVPVARGAKGFELMWSDVSEEEERGQVSQFNTPHLQQLSKDVNLMQSKLGPVNFWTFASDAANIAPSLVETGKGSLAGGAGGAAVGAGLGFLSGNASGVGLALPEEVVSVPTGAAWGWRIGATTGGAAAGARMNMGNVYLDLREKGISKPVAQKFATASGAVMGAMEYFGLRQMSGVARKAFAKQLATPAGKAAVAGMLQQFQRSGVFGRVLEGAASETVTETGQEMVQLTTEALAQWAQTGDEVWNNPKFWEEAAQRVSQTAVQTARGSLLLAGGAEAGGTAAGKAVNQVQQQTGSFQAMLRQAQLEGATAETRAAKVGLARLASGDVSMQEAFEAVKSIFTQEGQEQHDKNVEAVMDMTDEEALAMLSKPASQGLELDATDPNGPSDAQIAEVEQAMADNPEAAQAIQELAQNPEAVTTLQAGISQAVNLEDQIGQTQESSTEVQGPTGFEDTPFGDFLAPQTSGDPTLEEEAITVDETPVDFGEPTPAELDTNVDEELSATNNLTRVEAQARITQINNDIRALQKKESQLDKMTQKRMERGYSVNQLLERTEKIISKREELELEKELLHAGLLSREEVAERRGQARISVLSNLVGRIQNSADRLYRTRQKYQSRLANQKVAFQNRMGNLKTAAQKRQAKAEDKAFRSGQFTEQKTIRSLQGQLIQVINAATQDRQFRQRLKTMVNKVSNRKQFNTATRKIQAELQNLIKKKNDAQYQMAREKVLAGIDRAIKDRTRSGGKGNPVSTTLDADTTKRLKTFRTYLEDQPAAQQTMSDFLTQYGAQLQQGQMHLIPDEDLENFNIASMAHDLNKQDLMSLNIIAGNVGQWLQDGRDAVAQKKQALAQQRAQEKAISYQSVGVDPAEVRKAKSLSQEKKRPLQALRSSFMTFNTLMDWISPKDGDHAITQMTDITESRENYLAGKEMSMFSAKEKMEQALQAIGSKKSINQKMYEDSRKTVKFDYIDQHGATVSLEIDRAQLIEAGLKLRDDTLHASMRDTNKGNAWTLTGDSPAGTSFQEQVESALTNEDKAVIQAILDFYQDYHARFNTPYREKYGVDLPMRDNYSPVSRKGYMVDPGNSLEFGSLLPGAAISRQNTLLRIDLQNPYTSLENHVDQVERFDAFDSVLGTMRNVFGDDAMRGTIRQRYGGGTVSVIDDYVNRFVQNRTTNWQDSDSLISALMSDLSLSALTFKSATQFLTQMTSTTAMWANYSPVEIAKGAIAYAQNVKATEDALRSSATMAHRFKSGASYEFKLATQRNSVGLNLVSALLDKNPPTLPPAAYKVLSNALYGAMRLGDAGVARVGGGPVYHAELARGASPEQALLRTVQLMEQTQQGDDPSQMPSLYANNQYAYLFGGLFALQPLQLLGMAQTAINDFTNSPSRKTATQMAGKIATMWLIPGFTYGLIRNMPLLLAPPEDDDELKKEAWMDIAVSTILGPGNAAPLVGDIIERAWWGAASFLVGQDAPQWTKGARDNPIAELYTAPAEALAAWMKLAEDENSDVLLDIDDAEQEKKQSKAIDKSVKAVSRWTGTSNALLNMPSTVVEAFEQGDYVAAVLAIAGASPSKIKKRLAAGAAPESDVQVIEEDQPTNFFGDNSDIDATVQQQLPLPEERQDDPTFSDSEMDAMMQGDRRENRGR